VLNAANEVAVEAFLAHRLRFTAMPDLIADALSRPAPAAPHLDDLLALDAEVRARVREALRRQEAAA
jgi:1-deoxy-D-xylulose-5-phosphate reductoisomerase